MMQSILSLITETLTTKPTAHDSGTQHTAKRHTERGEFQSILDREDPNANRNSATRIKARESTIDKNDDETADDEDVTTCVNVDDFAAWALTSTIAAPSMKNPSISMMAVKGDAAPPSAPKPLPALDAKAGETIPAAAMAPKTQELASPFFGPKTQELAALGNAKTVEMESPLSSAITREFGTPVSKTTAASVAAANQAAAQNMISVEKLARSSNATDIPPPSGLPMVSNSPPAIAAAQAATTTSPKALSPADEAHARLKSGGAAASAWLPAASRPIANSTNAAPMKFARVAKMVDLGKPAALPLTTPVTEVAMATASMRPLTYMLAGDTDTASPMIPVADPRMSTDARQEAATAAVNQMTLRRAADGELDIPELGRVRVDASTRDGEVDVRIAATRPSTQILVANHLHEIVLDAKSAAIPVGDVRVDADTRGESRSNFSSSQDAPRGRNESAKNDEASEKEGTFSRGSNRARIVL
ncbi:MAG: hypothetical protein ABI461_09500 [Polyangiaceae bacterium]